MRHMRNCRRLQHRSNGSSRDSGLDWLAWRCKHPAQTARLHLPIRSGQAETWRTDGDSDGSLVDDSFLGRLIQAHGKYVWVWPSRAIHEVLIARVQVKGHTCY